MRVGIIGCGLAGMITAMELADAGHKVEIFDGRRFHGGKVGSWLDKDENHIEVSVTFVLDRIEPIERRGRV